LRGRALRATRDQDGAPHRGLAAADYLRVAVHEPVNDRETAPFAVENRSANVAVPLIVSPLPLKLPVLMTGVTELSATLVRLWNRNSTLAPSTVMPWSVVVPETVRSVVDPDTHTMLSSPVAATVPASTPFTRENVSVMLSMLQTPFTPTPVASLMT
jgi:hypothetical protein